MTNYRFVSISRQDFHIIFKISQPVARHTTVDVFSNRAEFLWPPGCSHNVQPTWQMESCTTVEEARNCRRDSLRLGGGSRYEAWITLFIWTGGEIAYE